MALRKGKAVQKTDDVKPTKTAAEPAVEDTPATAEAVESEETAAADAAYAEYAEADNADFDDAEEADFEDEAEGAEDEACEADDPPFEHKEVEEVEAVAEPARQEVATRTETAPATQETSAGGVVAGTRKVAAEMAQAGFAGIDVDSAFVFPIVALKNEGIFESSEGWNLGKEFECVIMSSRPKYIMKNTKCEKRDDDMAYSYDQVCDSNSGQLLEEIRAEWAEKGWGWEIKEYLECVAQVQGGDYDGEIVLLSIPPTSKGRFSAHTIRQRMQSNMLPSDYITICSVGAKVEKVDHPFYPWAFARAA